MEGCVGMQVLVKRMLENIIEHSGCYRPNLILLLKFTVF